MPFPPPELDGLARLNYWQELREAEEASREFDASERERARVEEALSKSPDARTELDWVWLAYSPYSGGGGCRARGYFLG